MFLKIDFRKMFVQLQKQEVSSVCYQMKTHPHTHMYVQQTETSFIAWFLCQDCDLAKYLRELI